MENQNSKAEFSTDQIFRLLTLLRALQLGSKRYTLSNRDFFFEPFEGFSLDDIYHALDIIAVNQEELQKQMIYYSEKYAKKQKADREAMILKCARFTKGLHA